VAIARALVFEPEVLLLDEPLSNLDARLRTQMGDEFRALQKRLGITTIYVTHDQEEAMALSDRVVVMQSGRILQVGTPEEIYQRPATRAVAAFFGSPNLLDAKVTGCVRGPDNKFELAVAGVNWSGHCLAGEPFATGEPVLVLVRPENVRVDGEGASRAPMGGWSGRITDAIFRGPRRSMVVDTDGLRLNVEAPPLLGVRVGDAITLKVPPAGAWAIRTEGRAHAAAVAA
jgi:iron(III) transport system ATP-binding protein